MMIEYEDEEAYREAVDEFLDTYYIEERKRDAAAYIAEQDNAFVRGALDGATYFTQAAANIYDNVRRNDDTQQPYSIRAMVADERDGAKSTAEYAGNVAGAAASGAALLPAAPVILAGTTAIDMADAGERTIKAFLSPDEE